MIKFVQFDKYWINPRDVSCIYHTKFDKIKDSKGKEAFGYDIIFVMTSGKEYSSPYHVYAENEEMALKNAKLNVKGFAKEMSIAMNNQK
jgi:hypothetical protein